MSGTALDAPNDALDEHEQNFVASIREHGWFRTGVAAGDETPGFAYTTGFTVSAQHPELIVFALRHDIAHNVFWDLYRMALGGEALVLGRRTDQAFANLPAYAFPVAKRHYADHLGWSRWFYGGDDFACLQIVWPDRAGVFPWEAGFDETFRHDQPDLTERGWKAEVAD